MNADQEKEFLSWATAKDDFDPADWMAWGYACADWGLNHKPLSPTNSAAIASQATSRIPAEEKNVSMLGGTFSKAKMTPLEKKYNEYAEKAYTAVMRDMLDGEKCDNVLDAGCGDGVFGPLLRMKASGTLTGLDISGERLKEAAAMDVYDELLLTNIADRTRLRGRSFDCIVCSDVMVHVLEDYQRGRVLRALHGLLDNNYGVLLLNFTNSLYGTATDYCRGDSLNEVFQALDNAGFSVERVRGCITGWRTRPKSMKLLDATLGRFLPWLSRVMWFKAVKSSSIRRW